MKLEFYHGDILDLQVDVLVCSANVSLNLSGGVGGALLSRYGADLQTELHSKLPTTAPRFAKRGDVIITHPKNTPYKAVFHAVAVDAFYNSSCDIIHNICRKVFLKAAEEKAESLALPLLATGYGHLPVTEFIKGFSQALEADYSPLRKVIIAVQSDIAFIELKNNLSVQGLSNMRLQEDSRSGSS